MCCVAIHVKMRDVIMYTYVTSNRSSSTSMPIFRKRLQRFSRFNGETCHISDLWARLRSFQTDSSISSYPRTDSGIHVSRNLWSSASVCCGHRRTFLPRSRLPLILRPREGWRLKRKFNVLNLSSSWSGRSFSYGGNVTICVFAQRFCLSPYPWFGLLVSNLNYPSFPVLLLPDVVTFLEQFLLLPCNIAT